MSELSPREYEAVLRSDLGYFAERCFYQLNPQAAFLTNWHIEVIAAKLTEVRAGKIGRPSQSLRDRAARRGPRVRIRFPPAWSQQRTVREPQSMSSTAR
jgi:hypothetical protein